MDNVPYAFIESVLTRLVEENLGKILAISDAPLWSSAAQTHLKKLKIIWVYLHAKANGNLQFFCHFTSDRPERIAYHEMIEMDRRFVRIRGFYISPIPRWSTDNLMELPVEELPALISFMAQFRLDILEISGDDPHFLGLLEGELAKSPLSVKKLALGSPGFGGFLRTQLTSLDLTDVNLDQENCPEEIRDDLVAFACSPKSIFLHVCGFQFDFETLSRIVASWKRGRPGQEAELIVPTSGNLAEEFAALIPRDRNSENRFREEAFGEYSLQAQCFENCVIMRFNHF